MKPEWKTFLEAAGAIIDDGKVVSFGSPSEETQAVLAWTVIADLSHLGLIAASGADAQSFLQGQFANDVVQVTEQCSQLNTYCSPKGRTLAVFRLFKRAGVYYLLLPREVLDSTLKRLRLFVLRSQVTLTDASDDLLRLGLSGPEAEAALKTALGFVPSGINVTALDTENNLTLLRIPGPHARFVIAGEDGAIKMLWDSLKSRAKPVGAAPWALLDIHAGIPTIYPATVDVFVPQMLNLQAIGGLSFKKGCYPGQEIVARMQHLGTLKRRMYRAHVDATRPPKPGDTLYTGESEQSAGQVVNAQPGPEGGFELLAVMQNDSAGKARLHDRQGSLLHLRELPYELEI